MTGRRYLSPFLAHANKLVLALVLCVIWFALQRSSEAAEKKYWNLSPYRIQIHIAVDSGTKPRAGLANELVMEIDERIRSTLFPLWTVKLSPAEGPWKHRLLTGLESLDDEDLPPESPRFDKLLFLTVRATATGYELQCREYDCSVFHWGSVLRSQGRQELFLSEGCFALLRKTFSPLASIRSLDEEEDRVALHFKGSDLPRQTDESLFTETGDVYRPVLVRITSAGEVTREDVKGIPWTYLTLTTDDQASWLGEVHSGIRMPFGVRRRGRVEQLAIASRHSPGTTTLRFYARHDQSQSLSGYEVFRRESKDEESSLLGFTNADGTIEIEPGKNSITTLFLRSDGQLLAKIPVAPGALPRVEVPVADDPARLQAQADLEALREKLIDVVARRNILMARTRDRLQTGEYDEAQKLLSELEDLPRRTDFDHELSTAENNRRNRSPDARIQSRIERMFADTQKLLGRFLDAGEVEELKVQVRSAGSNDNS